ncbi:MAG TPA: phosphoadenylyl-sulfate reductase [Methylocella sp.]|nr:phosphoadenylyl-sulfate reductase [Methylocella sp.]
MDRVELRPPLLAQVVAEKAADLNARFAQANTQDLLRAAITELFPGRIALVSSFGADSAVLLQMIAEIDKKTPVLFIDTRLLFEETRAYRDLLAERLGLENLVTLGPDPTALANEDPENFLWASQPDRCCEIRKVLPLDAALADFDAWISGRKRFQSATRRQLNLFEADPSPRIKINPLTHWTAPQIVDYLHDAGLPSHPLVAKNYPSIGCIPCTSPVKPGENPRAGRWRGKAKLECGLHTPPSLVSVDF